MPQSAEKKSFSFETYTEDGKIRVDVNGRSIVSLKLPETKQPNSLDAITRVGFLVDKIIAGLENQKVLAEIMAEYEEDDDEEEELTAVELFIQEELAGWFDDEDDDNDIEFYFPWGILPLTQAALLISALFNAASAFGYIRPRHFLAKPNELIRIGLTEAQWTMKERELRAIMDMVYEGMQEGKTRHEIITAIMESERRGDASETAVYYAVQSLPYVEEVTAHPKWGDFDYRHGIDLTVKLKSENPFGLSENDLEINIQVKSSQKGVEKAKLQLQKKHSLQTEAGYKRFLAEHRIIFINAGAGSRSETQLQRAFEGDLKLLASYIKEYSSTALANNVMSFLAAKAVREEN